MKVIGKTEKGYLVDMAEEEIAIAAGFCGHYDTEWSKRTEKTRSYSGGLSGMTIEVKAAYAYHARVMRHQEEARQASNTLRALADIIGGALPDVVIPPAEDKKDNVNGED